MQPDLTRSTSCPATHAAAATTVWLLLIGSTAVADELGPVVVLATRRPQASADVPVSVDRVDGSTIQTGQLEVNISETLDQVPGVNAQNRQNYAQDLQLSVRGFGARSSFGVRGVRLYADGIPGTMPDGQGQFSQFDLGSADRIEILRGPFSALYGNSSGGVISIFTKDGRPGFGLQGSATAGSLGVQRYALEGGGDTGEVNYILSASHFQTNGYRDHSEAERDLFNSKIRITLDSLSTLTIVGNAVSTPFVQDPLGLTHAQWNADPTQAGTNAVAYNTRKSLSQEQAGATYERKLAAEADLTASGYVGQRHTTQFQAILRATEARPKSPGGVIDLGRSYWGVDVHATGRYDLGGPLQVTAGVSYDELDEARHGYNNFLGNELGVIGALRRDEQNRVYDFDQYLQAQWEPAARWRVVAGVRHSSVDMQSDNHLATNGAPAFSSIGYHATNPVAGITYSLRPTVNLYAAYGKGFETPTLNDLAYRSTDGSIPGLNLGLQPARSDNYELGAKAGNSALYATVAAFYVRTVDELAVASSSAGRSVYQNIGETHRKGIEVSFDAKLPAGLSSRLAYTYLQALTSTPYTTCAATPCLPVTIPSGNRLPAVPANAFYGGVTWQATRPDLSGTLEAIGRAQIYADDRNSDAAPGYWIFNAHATWRQQTGRWRVSEFLRVDNLFGRHYAGSVIVNDANRRFFEPEPGRAAYLGIKAEIRP